MQIQDLNLKNEKVTFKTDRHNIKVKEYLPLEEKLKLVAEVLNLSIDQNSFKNILKIKMWTDLMIIRHYTDLELESYFENEPEDKDYATLYDLLINNDIITEIRGSIPTRELAIVEDAISTTVEDYFKYTNSARGILEAVSQDYSNLDLEASDIQKKLGDPDNMKFLKDVMERLG